MTIWDLEKRLELLTEDKIREIAYNVLFRHKDDLINIQKEQLASGRDLSGKLLSPTIDSDPYFKGDKAWANWWIKHKNQIQPSSSEFSHRPENVANLIFSTGIIVWDWINVFSTGKDLRLGTEFSIQMELENKYGDLFGLNPEGANYAINTFFKDEFLEDLNNFLLGG